MKKFLLFAAAAMVAAGASAATEWVSLIEGGNAADGQTPSIIAGWSGPAAVVANPSGAGDVFEIPIAANPENPWDSQLFIKFNEPLSVGDKFKVSFDYYCSDSRSVDIQAQGEPGAYHNWTMGIDPLGAKPEWQSVNTAELEVSEDMAKSEGFITMAFNLASAPEAATFYINKVVILHEVEGGEEPVEPSDGWTSIINGGIAADGVTESLQAGWNGAAQVVANPAGEGVVFNFEISENTPNDNGAFDDWKSQMFICFNEPLMEGDVVKVEFDHYCTDTRNVGMQAQGDRGSYQGNFQGFETKAEWQKYSQEITVTEQYAGAAGFKNIAICLSSMAPAATFYMNNLVVAKKSSAAVETIAPVKVATGVFNLQGIKVADSLDEVAAPGLYITNGTKVIKK